MDPNGDPVHQLSSPQSKVALFVRSLGTGDVVSSPLREPQDRQVRLSPACANEWAAGICQKPKIKVRRLPATQLLTRYRRCYPLAPRAEMMRAVIL